MGKNDVFNLKLAQKVLELAKLVKCEPRTGFKDIDAFLTHRSQLCGEIVEMTPTQFQDLCYSPNKIEGYKGKVKLSELCPPIIDITAKQSDGKKRAMSTSVKEIPVIVLAKKEAHIKAWKVKNGIK